MPARVILIGLDAADATLLERWAGEGRLPALADLAGRSAAARLTNSLDTLPGAIWPEIVTGRDGGRLGLYYHARQLHTGESLLRPVEPEDHDPRLYLWSVAGRAGRRAGVVDVPQVVRAPDLDGVQVFEWGLHDRSFSVGSEPPGLLRALDDRHGPYPVDRCDHLHGGTVDGYLRLREALLDGVRRKTGLILDVLAREEFDLFVCAYGEPHCVGHQFWHFLDERHPDHDAGAPPALRDAIPDVYAAIDAGVAAVVDAAGRDAAVLLLASHGMGTKIGGPQLLPEVLARLGFTGSEPPQGLRVRLRSRLPKGLRAVVGRFLPRRARERAGALIGRRRGPMDDPATRALAIRNNRCGGIRLNLTGREPSGTVRPGPEADALIDEITAELRALREPGTGRPIVDRVVTVEEAFGPDHHPDLPDLIVVFRRDLGTIEACESPRVGTVRAPVRTEHMPRTGDHTEESRLWIAAPGFPAGGRLPDGSVLDVTPTVLDLLDVPRPEWIDGRSLRPVG